ncbi:MAG: DUF4145 domain-containing protein [Bacteroidota bacterium]|nr:MAG: DUF4145 domain-containing protein [Bacteroidota bacterium]
MSTKKNNIDINSDLHEKLSMLSKMLIKSFGYADADPDTFLLNARKTTETICKFIYNKEIGEEDGRKMMLNDFGRALVSKRIIPERIGILIGTIQTYGNYGAHAQDDLTETPREWIAPCQTALANLSNWFFLEYLKGEIPGELTNSLRNITDKKTEVLRSKKGKIKKLLLAGLVLMFLIAIVFVIKTVQYPAQENTEAQNSTNEMMNEQLPVLTQAGLESEEKLLTKSPDAIRLMVLYFQNSSNDVSLSGLSKGLADMLITDLSKFYMLQVVERDRLESILNEQDISNTSRFDAATAVKIGKILGAEVLLTGSYFEMAGNLRIDARIIDVETSAVVKSEGVTGKSETFFELEKALAKKILSGLSVELKEGEDQYLRTTPANEYGLQTGLRYSQALDMLDKGNVNEARSLLKLIVEEAPQFEAAQTALKQIEI